MENIEDIKEQLISYCKEHKVALFYGEIISDGNISIIDWDITSYELISFLETLKINSSETVILNTSIYRKEDHINEEEIDFCSDDSLKELINDTLKTLNEFETKIYEIKISLIRNQVCYQYHQTSKWIDELEVLQDLYGDIENSNMYDRQEQEEDEDEDEIKYQDLSNDQIIEFANELIKNEEYYSISYPHTRREFAYDYFEERFNTQNIEQILTRSEKGLDKYLIGRVRELKLQGKKKSEIADEMSITVSRVNKYY